MSRSGRTIAAAGLAAIAIAGMGGAATANPHLKTCLDPDFTAPTIANFCTRALDWGALKPREEAAAWTNLGVANSELGRHGEALNAYDRAVAADPGFQPAFANRALAREKRGQLKGALDDFDRALRLDPRDAGSLVGRGSLYLKRGMAREAAEDFVLASRLDPRNGKAHYNRGLAMLTLGRLADAERAFSDALAIAPDDAEALVQRGRAKRMRDPNAALADFSRAIEIAPDLSDAYVERGRLFDAAGRRGDADKDYRRAFELGYSAPWLNDRLGALGG